MIYFDHNASTALAPSVLEAMLPYLQQQVGNASSIHASGRLMRQAIEQARHQVADFLGAQPHQVIFTSGGTEANNLALKGAAWSFPRPGTLAVSAIEHEAVLMTANRLEETFGWRQTRIPVDGQGRVQMETLEDADIISVMWANNEVGTIQDMTRVVAHAKALGAWVHSDAVQAAGRIPVHFGESGLDMLSVSAHKIGGPQGVGALIVSDRLSLVPLLDGGGHEDNRRSGTENVAGIVGFGQACLQANKRLFQAYDAVKQLQMTLESALAAIPGVECIAVDEPRLPNTCMLSVKGIAGEMLVMALDKAGIAVSGGAACGSEKGHISHVLAAMGVPPAVAECAIRVSLSPKNTEDEIQAFVGAIKTIIEEKSA